MLDDLIAPPAVDIEALTKKLSRFNVFGTHVHGINRSTAKELLAAFVEDRSPRQIVTVNVDFLRIAESVPELKQVINTSHLAVPDGKPVAWLGALLGIRGCERVTGPDLIDAAAALSNNQGTRIFFLGGTALAAEGAKQALTARYPNLNVCDMFAPAEAVYPFHRELDDAICERILAAKPDVLFVAFGCPKQDLWISEHLARLGVPVCVGIGGSFNFLGTCATCASRNAKPRPRMGLQIVARAEAALAAVSAV